MKVDDFRLAAASLDEFSDDEIRRLMPTVEIESEADIFKFVRTLTFHRPHLAVEFGIRIRDAE